MDKKQKIKICISIFVITLVLIIIFTPLYMHYLYNPIQLIGIYEYDEEFRKLNRSILQDSLSLILILSSVASLLIVLCYEFIVLHIKRPIKVRAQLKSKEIIKNMNIVVQVGISFNIRYALTFVLENGREKIFYVKPKQYALILDGNKGVLTYNENLMKRFISFYVDEIQ